MPSKQQLTNNFDLLRLFAAVHVVLYHCYINFKLPGQHKAVDFINDNVMMFFHGVPIFFVISGFLIFWSFDRNHDLKKYITNRALRIFPALWFCILLTVVSIYVFELVPHKLLLRPTTALWCLTQGSFLQFWNPEYLKTYGVGAPNGSLWTITVELQFYILVPLLSLLLKRISSVNMKSIVVGVIALLSFFENYYFSTHYDTEAMIFKLNSMSLLPYLFYFCFGILLYLNFDRLAKYIEGKFLFWLLVYAVYFIVLADWLQWYHHAYFPNFLGFISNALLAITVISFAFTKPGISEKLLKGNDLSYGFYIYHMPIINVILFLVGMQLNYMWMLVTLIVCFLLSWLSWVYIEKKALRLKRK